MTRHDTLLFSTAEAMALVVMVAAVNLTFISFLGLLGYIKSRMIDV